MQGRLQFRSDEERGKALALGTTDVEKVLSAEDLAGGNVMVAATGVTNGDFLKGVRFTGDGARSHSVVMRSKTGTLRYIESVHRFTRSAAIAAWRAYAMSAFSIPGIERSAAGSPVSRNRCCSCSTT